jgi:mannose-6-phosphate isomerase-like protein (cupin superfamily)
VLICRIRRALAVQWEENMKHEQVKFNAEFSVLSGNESSQAAVMVLGPGESTGGPDNRHAGSDQWLYVASGDGAALVEGMEIELHAGSLVLIGRGEAHEISNTGHAPLETINFYVPPAY